MDDLLDGIVYSWTANVYSSLDNTAYKQEITCKLNENVMGVNGDNSHLTSSFSGQCTKGDAIKISSYKTGGNYNGFFTRVILIPM